MACTYWYFPIRGPPLGFFEFPFPAKYKVVLFIYSGPY